MPPAAGAAAGFEILGLTGGGIESRMFGLGLVPFQLLGPMVEGAHLGSALHAGARKLGAQVGTALAIRRKN